MYQDISALVAPESGVTRRNFLVTSIIAGFALAAQPIQAQTQITTDTNGLVAGEIKIPMPDGVSIPAYRARPDKKNKKFPVVLVIHEIFGVHEYIQDVCRRFAKLGHVAVAPYLYARQGDVANAKDFRDIISKVVSQVPDKQVMSDLDATLAYTRKSEQGHAQKLGITGFCWGGRIVWLYAAHNPQVKAGAAWYGRLVPAPNAPKNELQPAMPIDVAASLTTPVLGLYGGKDQGIPVASVEEMRAALAKGKSKSEIIVYPEAQHGFHADYRPAYNAKDAADAWQRLLKWFKNNGAA